MQACVCTVVVVLCYGTCAVAVSGVAYYSVMLLVLLQGLRIAYYSEDRSWHELAKSQLLSS